MTALRRKFEGLPFYNRLDKRRDGFSLCMDYLAMIDDPLIIETGTLRAPDSFEGDGQSTFIWNWVKEQKPETKVISIDIDDRTCQISRSLAPLVEVINQNSIEYLNSLSPEILSRCRLLYLDSYDWSPEKHLESAFHHQMELCSVWRLLPSGCLIMVDDRHQSGLGKHVMVQFFLSALNIQPIYEGYQIAWIKP